MYYRDNSKCDSGHTYDYLDGGGVCYERADRRDVVYPSTWRRCVIRPTSNFHGILDNVACDRGSTPPSTPHTGVSISMIHWHSGLSGGAFGFIVSLGMIALIVIIALGFVLWSSENIRNSITANWERTDLFHRGRRFGGRESSDLPASG